MQWFGATYTKRYDQLYNRSGHLFQQKKRYLPDVPHAEMPDQKRVIKDVNIESVLSKAVGILKCDGVFSASQPESRSQLKLTAIC